MLPSLRQLEYAVAVAREGSFSAAARSCHVSQPALSSQLQQLERTLGVQLFERKNPKILVTEAGVEFVAKAEEIVRSVNDLVDGARAHQKPLTSELRIGVIPTLAPYVLPRVVGAIREEWPELELLIDEDTTARLLASLDDGDLDLLFLALDVDLGKLTTWELFDDAFFVAMPPNHRFAELESVSREQIAEEELLLLGEDHCLSTHVLEACGGRNGVAASRFRANSLATVVQMVTTGVGITLIPQVALKAEAACLPQLVVRPMKEKEAFRRVGLAWRPSAPREHEYELVADLLSRQDFF